MSLGQHRVCGIAGRLHYPLDADQHPLQFEREPIVFPVVPAGASCSTGEYGVLVLNPRMFEYAEGVNTDVGEALRIHQAGVVVTVVNLDEQAGEP